MKAKDMKCPECGKGFRDIDPDYDFGEQGLFPLRSEAANGHCENGHPIDVVTTWVGDVAHSQAVRGARAKE